MPDDLNKIQTRAINRTIADRLFEAADLLEQQAANPFRVNAYRGAADTVGNLRDDVAELAATGGTDALTELPGVGSGISAAILEMVRYGRWSFLERLRGNLDRQHSRRGLGVPGESGRRLVAHDRPAEIQPGG